MKQGRKTKSETVLMEKTLRECFVNNYSAVFTSTKTGHSRRIVNERFEKWSNELIEEMDDDFIRMQKQAKARGLLALEGLIADIKHVLNELKILNDDHMAREKALWKKKKSYEIEINKWLTDKIAKYTKDIFNMEQIKVMIQMKPTADVTLQLQIDEMLTKVKPEDLQQILDSSKDEGKKK